MEQAAIRPYWILDYGNPLYPPIFVGPDCTTPETCEAQCPGYFGNCSDGTYYCCGGVMRTAAGGERCNHNRLCPTNHKLLACACNPPPPLVTADRLAGGAVASRGSRQQVRTEASGGCNTPECISAFGRFAKATVAHFKGHNIIFECINEPNGMGSDNATDIAALCLSAGKAFTAAGELFVGPTTAGMDWKYLNTSMANGILGAFGGVSVHLRE